MTGRPGLSCSIAALVLLLPLCSALHARAEDAPAPEVPRAEWNQLDPPLAEQDDALDVSVLARTAGGPSLFVEPSNTVARRYQLVAESLRHLGDVPVALGPLAEHGGALYACTGPDVHLQRWDGQAWTPVGGEVAREAGFRTSRYSVERCEVSFDRTGAPVLVWIAHVGPKVRIASVARWDESSQKWLGIQEELMSAQSVFFRVGRRANETAILVYFQTHGRPHTARIYRWDGSTMTELASDGLFDDADSTQLAVFGQTPYLLQQSQAGESLRLFRWSDGRWSLLAERPRARAEALAFTPTGRPLALVSSKLDDGSTTVQLAVLEGATWRSIAALPISPSARVRSLDLDVDASGRPFVAWVEQAGGEVQQPGRARSARLTQSIP